MITPYPSFPQIQKQDASRGEGEYAVFMKILICTQIEVVSPPLSLFVFDNGGGFPLCGTEGVVYGWKSDLSDEEILEKLLALNLERAKS